MTQPPEYRPERTETQRLADDLALAFRGIRRDWDHMLRPGDTQPPGFAGRVGTPLPDHDQRDHDQRRLDRTLSLRRFTQDQLNAWSKAVMEDHGCATETLPMGTDVPAMAAYLERHADWLSGQEYAPDCLDEVGDLMRRCHVVAHPPRRETMRLGRCPLEIPAEQDVLGRCEGTVRYRLEHDERDGEAMATCDSCGECAHISWWEDRMFDDPELQKTLDADGVCRLVHRTWGDVITRATVRQWVRRGIIEPTASEAGKASTFDRDAVVFAVDLWKRRAGLGV